MVQSLPYAYTCALEAIYMQCIVASPVSMFSRETGQYFILCFYFRSSGGQRPRVAYVVEIVRHVAIKKTFLSQFSKSYVAFICLLYLGRQASHFVQNITQSWLALFDLKPLSYKCLRIHKGINFQPDRWHFESGLPQAFRLITTESNGTIKTANSLRKR